MRRIAVFAALAALTVPSGTAANTTCPRGGTLEVTGAPGLSGQAEAAIGLCVDAGQEGTGTPADAIGFFGGTGEAGVSTNEPCVYAVVDGDDENTLITSQGGGYFGLSNCDTGRTDPVCDGSDTGSGSNSGGCVTIRGVTSVPVPLLACGNTTGKAWNNSTSDGCSIP